MAVAKVPKELWTTPTVSTQDVGITAQNMADSEKTKLWTKYSAMNALPSSSFPNLLYDIFIQTLQEKDSNATCPEYGELQDKLTQISTWIASNKLSTDNSTSSEMTKLQYKQFPLWILEAGRTKVKAEHPSAHQLPIGAVNAKSDEFVNSTDVAKSEQFYNDKYKEANSAEQEAKRGKLHNPTRSVFFSEKIEQGYRVIKNGYIYEDSNLTKKTSKKIEIGKALGGPVKNINNKSVEIWEPIELKGFIKKECVDSIDITDPKWKFEYGDYEYDEQYGNGNYTPSSKLHQYSDTQVKFNNDDEKMSVEEKTCDIGDPKDPNARRLLLNKYKDNIRIIMSIPASQRTPDQVTTLWTSAFNTHDIRVLKECYSETVVSQQLVDTQQMGRDSVLATFKRMFESSDDVGLNVTNKIMNNGGVALEWKAWGTKTPSPSLSGTDSPQGPATNNNDLDININNNNNQRFINGCGIFHIQQGRIAAQELFWDQDVNWFSNMGILKKDLGGLHAILYPNKSIAPQYLLAQLGNENNNDGNGNGNDNGSDAAVNDSLEYSFERRGLLTKDWNEYNRNDPLRRKRRQFMTGIFWVSVGIMFAYVVPKYLNKRKDFPF